jgi:hypothetical protein
MWLVCCLLLTDNSSWLLTGTKLELSECEPKSTDDKEENGAEEKDEKKDSEEKDEKDKHRSKRTITLETIDKQITPSYSQFLSHQGFLENETPPPEARCV